MTTEKDGGMYETFDSGAGPVVPEKCKGDFDNSDSKEGLKDQGVEHGAIPTVPQK